MRIQDLAIIFVIIILPISIVLGAYTQMQISTISLQTEYDMKLIAATGDAIKAFQINTANSSTSNIANSKIRDIEASVSTFKSSIKSVFGLNGYSEEEMNEYIPALVYTMYDGFYIYSKFNNQNYLYETEKNADGEEEYVLYNTQEINGKKVYNDVTVRIPVKYYDSNPSRYENQGERKPLDKNGENIFGLKPYITYSAEYVTDDVDVVITYSLDNYISIKGMVMTNGEKKYWNESGYLIDGIKMYPDGTIKYNGIEIDKKQILKETLPEIGTLGSEGYLKGGEYEYIKYNGTKYYLDENNHRVIYFLNGNLMELKETNNSTTESAYESFKKKIKESDSAYNYYKKAYEFTKLIQNSSLKNLKYSDAKDYVIIDGKDYINEGRTNGDVVKLELWPNDSTKIFDFNSDILNSKPQDNIECEKSNFNQHRLAIIKNKIRTNLAIAISNFNSAYNIEFQMPELSDEDWAKVMNNISMISFVQGIEIGGTTYNGYTIINNSESKEVVREENIFILGNDNFYHRIGDKYLVDGDGNNIKNGDGISYSISMSGRLNLDFNRQMVYNTIDGSSIYYYPLPNYYASYNSVISQNYWDDNYDKTDDIYAYVANSNDNLKKAFYMALGREREGNNGTIDYKKVLVVGYYTNGENRTTNTQNIAKMLNEQEYINANYFCSPIWNDIENYVEREKNNYDLIIINAFGWGVSSAQNEMINNILDTTNLFTIGNDSKGLSIFKDYQNSNPTQTAKIQITELGQKKLGININEEKRDSQSWIRFNDNVNVLYEATYNGNSGYDAIGLARRNNKNWMHSQMDFNMNNANEKELFEKLVYYALNGFD